MLTQNAVVQRPLKVKVKAQDLDGNKFVLPLNGWPARIFQHEYDHLEVNPHDADPLSCLSYRIPTPVLHTAYPYLHSTSRTMQW